MAVGLEGLVQRISHDAEKRYSEAMAEAKREADAMLAEARAKAAETKSSASDEAQKSAAETKQRLLAAASLTAKKQEMSARREMIAAVQERAAKAISESKDRERMLRSAVSKALKELPDAKYIYARKADRELVSKIAPKLHYAELQEPMGGVVLADASNSIMANHTFGLLLDRVFEQNLKKIYNGIFGSAAEGG